MPSVEEIAHQISAREGGYVNDPDDPGGATKHGVTLATMRRLGIDLDGDGQVTASDVKRLTRARAEQVFVEEYFRKPGLALLPEAAQASVFDMYVNAGAEAVRLLQRLLNAMGYPVAIDGVIGPETAKAAEAAARGAPVLFADAYGIARRDYYYALADRRPASRKYARRKDGGKGGWILRAEEFISPRFRLSDAEHRERTASWG
ncbi:holin-associated N-acetylmuramidase [Albidovulum sp.]|uniref:holin-associated N-acetylmuramidase n=1 Tax=Albidovulum sp. TaxID=1872424 RepID=UPI001D4F080E|nr:peptidoglycan-binding protein [Paracoccaceae bacterium]MCC0046300.1 peptidoglycan-binding protein [Defluviimonas sp.]HPE25771.1 holin-associated N-acetylmuramidase [Albidovulum sp.]MCB2118772.1 peptidoglycan-binding protein [Paracoccaceae bacterium]MCB2121187.1 peptidoglycan-binding protein [Paracoccaceae bacterium]